MRAVFRLCTLRDPARSAAPFSPAARSNHSWSGDLRALRTHPTEYETNLLLENGQVWLRSEGSIRMFEQLGFPWACAALARVVPRSLRDRIYDVIARNRLGWFGVRQICFVSMPGDEDRFLA